MAVGAREAVADLGWSAQLRDNLLILYAVEEQGVRSVWGLWPNLQGNKAGNVIAGILSDHHQGSEGFAPVDKQVLY